MSQLQFKAQPLFEVSLRAVFEAPTRLNFELVARLVQDLSEDLPQVISFSGGALNSGGVFRFTLGSESIIHLRGNDIEVKVNEGEVIVFWHRGLPMEYPRFDRLIRVLVRVLDSMPSQRFQVANMSYLTRTSGPNWHAYVKVPTADFLQDTIPVQLNMAFLSSENIEYRLQGEQLIEPNGQIYGIISTTGGVHLGEDDSPPQTIQDIHAGLQRLFRTVLTDQALLEWQYVDLNS